ncbi:superoxide dismutase [Candidatus Dependentiae bacterium]|nr:superoxide dismutase [Candidatus Dependentiae bacterium]
MFVLPVLPYSYDALEPYIDAKTMEIHLTKHHQTYVTNLNKALHDYPDLQKKSLEDLLLYPSALPDNIKTAVKNNAGGHYGHSLFWKVMKKGGSPLQGDLLKDIDKQFGSFQTFKEKFENAAKTQFGSGWAWLVVKDKNKLEIIATSNQDVALTLTMQPILCLDVWEHAYYLHYQNRRADYIQAWWNVVHWDYVQELYAKAVKK